MKKKDTKELEVLEIRLRNVDNGYTLNVFCEENETFEYVFDSFEDVRTFLTNSIKVNQRNSIYTEVMETIKY